MAETRIILSIFKGCQAARVLCQAAALCTLSCAVVADNGMFLPNSLKSSQDEHSAAHPEIRSLCNKQLLERSKQIRSTEMTATHRALNYDWLASYSENSRQYHGGRAFSKIAQKMLRQYWDRKRQELGDNALLDEKGNLKRREYNGVDYGLTTSGGGLNFGFNYSFE